MSERAQWGWTLLFCAMLLAGTAGLIIAHHESASTSAEPLPVLQAMGSATLEQLDETYVVTAGVIGGHTYLFIRIVGTDVFVAKHAAMCAASHPGGFHG